MVKVTAASGVSLWQFKVSKKGVVADFPENFATLGLDGFLAATYGWVSWQFENKAVLTSFMRN